MQALRENEYIIITKTGSPVFSRHGYESEWLSSYCAMLSAIFPDNSSTISIATSNYVCCAIGGLYYIANTTCSIENSMLRMQWLHSAMLMLLTSKALDALQEDPCFDMRRLVREMDGYLQSLLDHMDTCPMYDLNAFPCASISVASRQIVHRLLLTCATPHTYATVLIHHDRYLGIVEPSSGPIHTQDLILLLHFLQYHEMALNDTESWIPICLPQAASVGFLWAMVSTIVTKSTYLITFSTDSSSDEFHRLQQCKTRIQPQLLPHLAPVPLDLPQNSILQFNHQYISNLRNPSNLNCRTSIGKYIVHSTQDVDTQIWNKKRLSKSKFIIPVHY